MSSPASSDEGFSLPDEEQPSDVSSSTPSARFSVNRTSGESSSVSMTSTASPLSSSDPGSSPRAGVFLNVYDEFWRTSKEAPSGSYKIQGGESSSVSMTSTAPPLCCSAPGSSRRAGGESSSVSMTSTAPPLCSSAPGSFPRAGGESSSVSMTSTAKPLCSSAPGSSPPTGGESSSVSMTSTAPPLCCSAPGSSRRAGGESSSVSMTSTAPPLCSSAPGSSPRAGVFLNVYDEFRRTFKEAPSGSYRIQGRIHPFLLEPPVIILDPERHENAVREDQRKSPEPHTEVRKVRDKNAVSQDQGMSPEPSPEVGIGTRKAKKRRNAKNHNGTGAKKSRQEKCDENEVSQNQSENSNPPPVVVKTSSTAPFCMSCDRCFASDYTLKRHRSTVHSTIPVATRKIYKCSWCSNCYILQHYLKKHVNAKHPNTLREPQGEDNEAGPTHRDSGPRAVSSAEASTARSSDELTGKTGCTMGNFLSREKSPQEVANREKIFRAECELPPPSEEPSPAANDDFDMINIAATFDESLVSSVPPMVMSVMKEPEREVEQKKKCELPPPSEEPSPAANDDFDLINIAATFDESLVSSVPPLVMSVMKEPGDSVLACLKCGSETYCKEHSNAHFRVQQSDLHSLADDQTSQVLRGHDCSSEINEIDVKNKKVATSKIKKRRKLNFAPKKKKTKPQVSKPASPQTSNEGEASRSAVGKKRKPIIVCQSGTSIPVRGLSNLGNTCYFNSVMQCLARTQLLLAELKGADHPNDIRLELKGGDTLEGRLTSWDQMTECLHETLTTLLSPGSAYVPSEFLNMVRKKHPQFEGCDQHDAHELLRHTLDSIRMSDLTRYQQLLLAEKGLASNVNLEDVPQETQKQLKELEHKVNQAQTFVPERTFKGKLVSRVECQDCHHSSEYIEGFLDLSLPILANKPHPLAARRKTRAVPMTPESTSVGYKDMSAKSRRKQKKSARRVKKTKKRQKNSGANGGEDVDEVAIEAHEAIADKQYELLKMEEHELPESGYSSEKASSSLRGSPLSALPAGAQFPFQQQREPNRNCRPPTYIPLHPDGTPDLAHLSLHNSIGSTLNPLCRSTVSIMEQEPDWRDRIHERYFSSLPESEESNDTQIKSSGIELSPAENSTHVGVDPPSNLPEPLSDGSTETPLRDSSPSKVEPISDDCAGDLSVSDGRKCPSETGRAATPPLRKIRSPHETIIYSVCEEDGDSPLEPLSATDEISSIKPSLCLKPETTAPVPDEDSLLITTVAILSPYYNAGASLRRDGGSEGKQSAPNNSLNLEGNESGNEKPMIAYIHEIDDLLIKQVDEIPPNSVTNAQEDSSCIEKPNDTNAEEKVEVVNHKLPSSEEGDFEPLLSTVPNNPKLSFETPEIKMEMCAKHNSLKKKGNRDPSEFSVESCLRQFTAIELLNGSNRVGCSVCTDRQSKGNSDGKTVLRMATKQLLIGQVPPVLILHLKRFQVQPRSARKLTKHVSFPLILDVSPFCSSIGEDKNKFNNEEPNLYSLYGIVEHRGTLNSGHYVAYIKVGEDVERRWYCISDSHAHEVTEERVLKAGAYLLFYSKITLPFS